MTDASPHPNRKHGHEHSLPPVGWMVSQGLTPYLEAVATMERHVAAIRAGRARELVWLLEHPPLYTAGTSAKRQDLLTPDRFPVFETGRGGEHTYHGPGQRIAYVMLDLKTRFGGDVHAFVATLEAWIIDALARLGIEGEIRPGRVGVWVQRRSESVPREDKIAALGIRVRHGVSFHGVSLNVAPDLSHYDGIVPCGIREHGVTSVRDLGHPSGMREVDRALKDAFEATVASIENIAAPLEGG